jgi:hypothetical protein
MVIFPSLSMGSQNRSLFPEQCGDWTQAIVGRRDDFVANNPRRLDNLVIHDVRILWYPLESFNTISLSVIHPLHRVDVSMQSVRKKSTEIGSN